jgi:hypothetical protein
MKRAAIKGIAAALLTGVFATGLLAAGPDRVKYPRGFEKDFKRYDIIDKPDRKIARFMYVDPKSAAEAKPGQPMPNGTVLVMEDHAVELDAAGNPVTDAAGRLKPTDKIVAVAVMEKRAGWGNDIPPDLRNGDWDYASYTPAGTVNEKAQLNNCFSCHLKVRDNDFMFTSIFKPSR